MTEPPAPYWSIDNLATAVLLFDKDLKLRAINAAGESLLSLSARQIWGQPADELNLSPAICAALRTALRTGQRFTEWDIELAPAPGLGACVDCMVTPLVEFGAEPMVTLEMISAEGHRRILREETMLAQHDVTHSLLQAIAHEVKNPLGGIRGAAQLLERQLDDVTQREYTRIVISEVDRLRKLLDRMIGPGAMRRKEQVNIHEVLERVRSLVEVEVDPSILIERDYDPSLPEFEGDRDQLIQAFLNIVRNAAQAIGKSGTILLRTRSQRQHTLGNKRHKLVLKVDIIDSGPGIPPELQKSVFYPMITGRPEGTGLGLSIAQSLVHQHAGAIEFSSRPGETVFTIWLPVKRMK